MNSAFHRIVQAIFPVRSPELAVLFVSAYYDDDIKDEAVEGGVICFPYKPLDVDDLIAAIHRALNGRPNG